MLTGAESTPSQFIRLRQHHCCVGPDYHRGVRFTMAFNGLNLYRTMSAFGAAQGEFVTEQMTCPFHNIFT